MEEPLFDIPEAEALQKSYEISAAKKGLLDALQARKDAAEQYEQAMFRAVAAGMSCVKIADTLNISETAVRLYKRRHHI